MTRSVTILGATGSVGRSTVDVIRHAGGRFAVEAVTGHRNVALLAAQARELGARLAVIADPGLYQELRAALAGTAIETAAGPAALVEAAARPADLVMAGIVGIAGLEPTLAAARRGATVAFANKECLVSAGPLLLAVAEKGGATLLPVDSEHNALFQLLGGRDAAGVEKLVLTASGGPFRTATPAAMAAATPEQAVAHPVWRMGAKISVDSATLMNKGLEIIEAALLFTMPEPAIEVVIHPQSIVHAMVAFADGSVLAQLGEPDMRTPIAYALNWPQRLAGPARRLDVTALSGLEFGAPDLALFPALGLARAALRQGGTAPAVLNAANEAAVAAFLDRRIGFLDIVRIVESALMRLPELPLTTLDDVRVADAEARRTAAALIGGGRGVIAADGSMNR